MPAISYRDQLRHPNWQRRRLEILDRAGFACECCQDGESTLHVHHKRYVKGRMAWEYDDSELVALCETCHEVAHAEMIELQQALLMIHPGAGIRPIVDLVRGYCADSTGESPPVENSKYFLIGMAACLIVDFPDAAAMHILQTLKKQGPDGDLWNQATPE